jgi:hypothetical protein
MTDPLSVTASTISLLQLTGTVLKYLRDVKDASADRKNLIHEISSTRGILSTLNETLEEARTDDESWSATIRGLEDPDGPLSLLKTTLQQLAATFEGWASATGIKKAANSLRWPFKQGEVEKILRVIERQKSTLSLALENDHVALSRKIYENTEAVRDDLAGLSREFAATRLDIKTDAEAGFLSKTWPILIISSLSSRMRSLPSFRALMVLLLTHFNANMTVSAFRILESNSSTKLWPGAINLTGHAYTG